MIIIEDIIGNSHETAWRSRLADTQIDWLVLDQWEAQKSRLRKATANNVEVALSLNRNTHLSDGDILFWDEAKRQAIVAQIQLNEVMVIDLTDILRENVTTAARTMFELGHALGNQHWPAVVKEDRVFVPLTVDRKVMASVMKTHALPGIRYDFMPGAEVIPYMAPHEARRLFGGAAEQSHAHPHIRDIGDDHSHHHGHGHDH